jgi:hypothetical protein
MKTLVRIASTFLIAGGAVMVSTGAFAQAGNCDDPRIDTAACKREAAAAAQAKRKGQLSTKGEDQYQTNALKRCQRQPEGAAREACEKRVLNKGNTDITGSVEGGGKMRRNEMPAPKN